MSDINSGFGNPGAASYLPPAFLVRMQDLLGEEYDAFLESYENKRTYGLRINTRKISQEEFEKICPFPVRKIPWAEGGYFYDEDVRPSLSPLYRAGLYYLQDPGAMVPASLLPVNPGDKVLDLCAAPGGKATALSAALGNKGLLVANDISATRVKALLRNLELFGGANTLILNEDPENLPACFEGYFDKILLDAPCSGEGMFRKDDSLARDWTPEKSDALVKIQRRLLKTAVRMLRPGGLLLYSTCTFSEEEDEGAVRELLDSCKEMHLIAPKQYEGFSQGVGPGMENCVRIYPHKMDSEGQFAALFQKDALPVEESDANTERSKRSGKKDRKTKSGGKKTSGDPLRDVESFFAEIGLKSIGGKALQKESIEIRNEKVYYVPTEVPDVRGLKFIRNGLYLGDLKKNRFEPSQPFALSLSPGDVSSFISLPESDPRLKDYLSGAPISIAEAETTCTKGWTVLCAAGHPLAFGKLVNGQLKNKYPAGWRA